MDSEVIAQIIGAGAVGSILAAVITAIVNRKKLGAEATSIISQAAGGLVENLAKDNTELRAERALQKAQIEDLEENERRRQRRDARIRKSMEDHNSYDKEMAESLRRRGIEVPDPPALMWPDEDEPMYDTRPPTRPEPPTE